MLQRTKTHIPAVDPIRWLASQPLYPKVFWKEKSTSIIRVGVGAHLSLTDIPLCSEEIDPDLRFYGGMRFFPQKTAHATWADFPATYFWIPQIEMECRPDSSSLFVYESGCSPRISLDPFLSTSYTDPVCLNRSDSPPFPEWKLLVEKTLATIHSQEIDKLVLARRTTIHLESPLSIWPLLKQLASHRAPSTVFLFQMTPQVSFFGATPEILFEKRGTCLTTEAIAGTRPKGSSVEEEVNMEQELLNSSKDRREFVCVKQAIEKLLLPLAKQGGWEGEDRVVKTSHLQHLYNRLHLELSHPMSDRQLIELLHPTPALGGYPKDRSLSLLEKWETFDRGWYGAPIGVISSQRSIFYAAIRCALLKEQDIHLFAGLGLVEGSHPEQEWEELNAKMSWFQFQQPSSNDS